MSSKFFTYASNYRNMDLNQVDTRTGQFMVNLPLENLLGNNLLGPEVLLRLHYNPLYSGNEGFGTGFSLGFSRFNGLTNILLLSNGETCRVKDGATLIHDHPQRNFRFEFANRQNDSEGYDILWNDGKIERLKLLGSKESFITQAIISPLGRSIELVWERVGMTPLLKKIKDQQKTLCQITYGDAPVIAIWPDTNESYDIVLNFEESKDKLISLTYNLSATNTMSWYFMYSTIAGYDVDLLTTVTHPGGMTEKVTYSDVKTGLKFPVASGLEPLPAVVSYVRNPGKGQPTTLINYTYTPKNFLGAEGNFGSWLPELDYIYNFLSDYTYGCTQRITESNQTVTITQTFNNYHLNIGEVIEKYGLTYRKAYSYYAVPGRYIDAQPPRFLYQAEKSESWDNGDGIVQHQLTTTEYDNYGNILCETTPIVTGEKEGKVTTNTWYAADGEDGCPAEPNHFVRFIKEQTIVPMKTDFDTPTIKMSYTYQKLGSTEHVVLQTCSVYSDDVLLSVQTFTYNGNSVGSQFGTITGISDTKYGPIPKIPENQKPPSGGISDTKQDPNKRESFTSNLNITTDIFNNQLQHFVKYVGHDNIESFVTCFQSPISGRILRRVDQQNVITNYKYDKLGRLTSRTDAYGTEYSNETTWTYAFLIDGSVITKKDASENRVKTHFDGAGQTVLQEKSDSDNPKIWYETFRAPTENKDYDLTEAFEETEPSPFDDEKKSGNVVTLSDKRSGKPLKITKVDSNNIEQGSHSYRWDGLGRLREETDDLGNVTKYTYDAYGRLLEKTLPDDTVITRTYEKHLIGNQIATISVTGLDRNNVKKTWALGNQSYDSLGRLKQRVSCGRSTSYVYEGASLMPSRVMQQGGRAVLYYYIPELGNAVRDILAGSILQNFNYDKQTGDILEANESNYCQINEWYTSGRLQKQIYTDADGQRSTNFTWLDGGELASYNDVTNAELFCERDKNQIIKISDNDLMLSMEYDDKGRVSKQTVRGALGESALMTTLAYDDFDRETRRHISDGGSTDLTLDQVWNKDNLLASRVLEISNVVMRREYYEYDKNNRLESYKAEGSHLPVDAYDQKIAEQKYKYDALNNITQVTTVLFDKTEDVATFLYENSKDPTQLTSVIHTHDHYPRTITLHYDVEGRLIKDEQERTLTYDELGRLCKLTEKNSPYVKSTYQYDAFNRLVRQVVDGEDVHDLYYRGDEIVNEIMAPALMPPLKKRFIKFGSTFPGINDGTGLVLIGTDQNGTLMWSRRHSEGDGELYSWSPYGSGNPGQLLGFNGQRMDPASGVYHLGNGYRAYSPILMRFQTPDNLSPFDSGGINPYGYCGGDPINSLDPSGHMSWPAIVGLVFGAVGLVAAGAAIGIAVASAGGILAALKVASGTTLVLGGMGIVGDVAAIASAALEDTDEQVSSTLSWVSLGLGLSGLAAKGGIATRAAMKSFGGHKVAKAQMPLGNELSKTVTLGGTMRNVDLIAGELYTFADTYKGASRLNIVAHGKKVGESSRMVVNSKFAGLKYMDADDLTTLLNKRYDDLKYYDNLRTISCYSGNGGQASFASRLSKATGKPVKGYEDRVTANFEPVEVAKYFRRAAILGVFDSRVDQFSLNKTFQVYKQNPFKFTDRDYYTWNYKPLHYIPVKRKKSSDL